MQAELAKDRAKSKTAAPDEKRAKYLRGLPIAEFVHAVTPKWDAPTHLVELCEAMEAIKRGETVRLCLSVPPRHSKTETTLHFIAQLLLLYPAELIFYLTYGASLSRSKSKDARRYAIAAGVKIDPKGTALHDWSTVEGGGLLAAGVDGPIKGRGPSRVFIVDDPIKDRKEAESPKVRQNVWDWFSDALGRCTPGVSIIVIHTRMHDDDLIGRLEKLKKDDGTPAWTVVNLPAVLGDADVFKGTGTPLWPARRPLAFFRSLRESGLSDYDWESQYMGRPRPRGAQVFKGVGYYSSLPKVYSIGKGLDLAYTAKTRADHSVGLVILRDGPFFLIAHVSRRQLELDQFIPFLVAQTAVFPGVYRFSASTTEKGIAQLSRLLPVDSIRIVSTPALTDKFVHSQRSAAYWNTDDSGTKPRRILVPDESAQAQLRALGLDTDWVKPFVEEVEKFTGVGDVEDDQLDAMFNAIDTFPRDAPSDTTKASDFEFSAGVSVDRLKG